MLLGSKTLGLESEFSERMLVWYRWGPEFSPYYFRNKRKCSLVAFILVVDRITDSIIFLNIGFSYLRIFCVGVVYACMCMFSSAFAYVCMYGGHLPVYACGRKIKWIPLTLPTLFLRQSLTEPGTCYFDSTDWPGRHHDLPVSFPSPSNGCRA